MDLDYKGAYLNKKGQLDAIIELTNAINNNASEDELFKIYTHILVHQTQLKKHLLFICSEKAEVKSNVGIDDELRYQKDFHRKRGEGALFGETFGEYFNIKHNNKSLAHVYLKFKNLLAKKEQLSFVKTVSYIVLVALENNKLTELKIAEEVIQKELNVAKDVQNMLFPKELPCNDNLEMHATYIPHRAVGGDYYDYIKKSPTEYVICIADVSGKGIPAALLMSNFQATLRTLVRQDLNLKDIVTELNNLAFEITQGEKFITAFIALLDLKRENLYYINAGHNPPYYVDKNHKITSLTKGTTLLGGLEKLPKIEIGKISLSDYSMLFSFTDGLVEVFNKKGEQLNEELIENFLKKEKTTNLIDLHSEMLDEITNFADGGDYLDDITILTCKFRFSKFEFLN